jgi:HlyD family secretion protein
LHSGYVLYDVNGETMSVNKTADHNTIKQKLNVEQLPSGPRRLRWIVVALVLILLALGSYLLLMNKDGPAVRYETAEVQQGDLTVTVTATGTLQPVNQVDVGSELSGIIKTVEVDFNDRVQRGQVLARLDTDRLKARVIESRASLDSARSKVDDAKATVLETRLRYQRCVKLAARELCPEEDLDTYTAAHSRAKAAEASALSQVAVAQATLDGNETELAKAEIRSPIDGLVLKREIEPGQTVAASLQAPVLFTLAEDLAKMELHVAVDEADIGKVLEGQTAVFTVDAYPERDFSARITQVRFAPQTVEGVVTYETVLSVDNSDLSLRPGMTANAVITVQQLQQVTLVSNSALRFTPPTPKKAKSSGGGIFGAMFRRAPSSKRRIEISNKSGRNVWILHDGKPEAVTVKTGASDGKFTEILSSDLQPGMAVITDAISIKND